MRSPAEKKEAHRIACAKYNAKNHEVLKEQARIRMAKSRKQKKETSERARQPPKSLKKPTASKPRRRSRTLRKSEPLPSGPPSVLSTPIHQIPPKFCKSESRPSLTGTQSNELPHCPDIYSSSESIHEQTSLAQLVQSNKCVRSPSAVSWTTDDYLNYFKTSTPERDHTSTSVRGSTSDPDEFLSLYDDDYPSTVSTPPPLDLRAIAKKHFPWVVDQTPPRKEPPRQRHDSPYQHPSSKELDDGGYDSSVSDSFAHPRFAPEFANLDRFVLDDHLLVPADSNASNTDIDLQDEALNLSDDPDFEFRKEWELRYGL